jgi:hypothetical protein
MPEMRRPGRNPRQGLTFKAVKSRPGGGQDGPRRAPRRPPPAMDEQPWKTGRTRFKSKK